MAYNLLGVLSNSEDDVHRPLATEDVVLSRHLHSTHAIMAHRGDAREFASKSKALVSHAAILLKGFAVPSVGGVPGLLDVAREGDRIIIDGTSGLVIVRPSSRTEREYQAPKQAPKRLPSSGT